MDDLYSKVQKKLERLERLIEKEKEELRKSLDVVNVLEYTSVNGNRLVFLQGQKEALLDVLDMLLK